MIKGHFADTQSLDDTQKSHTMLANPVSYVDDLVLFLYSFVDFSSLLGVSKWVKTASWQTQRGATLARGIDDLQKAATKSRWEEPNIRLSGAYWEGPMSSRELRADDDSN